jgi:hypothetical protein
MIRYYIEGVGQKMRIDIETFHSILIAMRKAGMKFHRRIGSRYDSMIYKAKIDGYRFTLSRREYRQAR